MTEIIEGDYAFDPSVSINGARTAYHDMEYLPQLPHDHPVPEWCPDGAAWARPPIWRRDQACCRVPPGAGQQSETR
jgi:hypothetical protein